MKDNFAIPKNEAGLKPIADGLWTLTFPLRFFGLNIGRHVSLLRISNNRLVMHSTGPFSSEQKASITSLGKPTMMLDATTMHDTFSVEAREAFPNVSYLVPEGFPEKAAGSDTGLLEELDSLTGNELETVRLEGMRFLTEYAVFHPSSRTLIVCDLLFNLVEARGYTRWAMKYLMGVKEWPAIDRPVRIAVRDKLVFNKSLNRVFQWDFDRIIVGHGCVIESDGKRTLLDAVRRAGFCR
jgi:hypothetical protein